MNKHNDETNEIEQESVSAPRTPRSITLPRVRLPLDEAVQLFGAFNGTKLGADDFAGAVLNLAKQPRPSGPASDEVRPLYQAVLARQNEAERSPESLSSMYEMARHLQAQGNLAEAEALMRQALDALKSRYGAQDEHTLRAQNALACLLQNQGRYGDARRLYLATVELQRRLLGGQHPDTIATMENLGTLLFEQDELDNAAPLMHEAVLCRRRTLGDMHPDTLRSFNNLALLLQKQGKLESAQTLLRQTLAGQTQVLGEKHAETLTTLANLAVLLEDLGATGEAEAMHARCLELRHSTLGRSHVDTLTSMNNLAAFLLAQSRAEEAAQLLRSAMETAQASYPTTTFFFANLQARYGSALAQVNDFEHAETHLVAGYNRLKDTLGTIHQRTQRALSALVDMYQAWGKPAKAATYRQVLAS